MSIQSRSAAHRAFHGATITALLALAAGGSAGADDGGGIYYVSLQPQGPDYHAVYGPQFPIKNLPVSVKLDIACDGGGLYKTFRANGDAAPVGYGGSMRCGNAAEWATVTAQFIIDHGRDIVHCEPTRLPLSQLGSGASGAPNMVFVKSINTFTNPRGDTRIENCSAGLTPASS